MSEFVVTLDAWVEADNAEDAKEYILSALPISGSQYDKDHMSLVTNVVMRKVVPRATE